MATTAEMIQAVRVGISLKTAGITIGGMDITIGDQVSNYYIHQDPTGQSDCFRLYNREHRAISRGAEVYITEGIVRLVFRDDSQIVIPISSEIRTPAQKNYFQSVGYYRQELKEF